MPACVSDTATSSRAGAPGTRPWSCRRHASSRQKRSERCLALPREGGIVIAFKGLPEDVAGLERLAQRQTRFRQLRDALRFGAPDGNGVAEARTGIGRWLRGENLEALLAQADVAREVLVDLGLSFARRWSDAGRSYFIANTTDRDVDSWIPLDDRSVTAVLFDPMSGRTGNARVRRSTTSGLEIDLSLSAHSSIIVVTTALPTGTLYPSYGSPGPALEIAGPWMRRFITGRTGNPDARQLDRLGSWTAEGGEDVRQFSGTALYTTLFARPGGSGTAYCWTSAASETARASVSTGKTSAR